ncbi:exodeoxyribonuclease VII small subunit [Phaeocystidibacter luteus]|uniref:Exodeoxyribonuclease 7 small subunit n=1 Tax=Phaeocystidibacter luteus TaxID=911197 RepID=A0A6N6RLR0_9FLAO|nr:exodeoxyribonuclease VII small subunit [Phaeocystidibacter luteus]KAB2814524.1 exodeoxyribonuclease VII small subunit [Phaeocystidibacter luteus]
MAKQEKLTYESASKELEEILENMKSGEIGVDELAANVERASKLIKYCYERLDQTEKKVDEILKDLGLE